jgi:outer membrane protein assembly factor BamB
MRLIVSAVLIFTLGFAWDVQLVRTFPLDNHGMSATGIYDIDGDRIPEILIPGNSQLYCYDTGGNLRWSFTPLSHYFPAVSSPVAADLDGNGTVEIVFSTPAAVYALSATGLPVWSRTLAGEGSVQNCISSVALGDINQDNRLEVFAYEVYTSRLLCLNALNGDTIWTYLPPGNCYFSVGTPTVADLNFDGTPEILGMVAFSGGGGQLYCLNATGTQIWNYNTPGSGIAGWPLASAAVTDLNDDDTLEVITTANYWGIAALDRHGRELWRRSISQHAAAYPAVGDIDGDDTIEVIAAFGRTIRCFSGPTGRDRWSFSIDSGYYLVSSPALADLDGDSLLEIIFAELKEGNPSDPNRPVWILNCQGQPLWNDTVGTTMSDPVCADIDQDRRLEFLIGPTLRSGYYYWFEVDTGAVAPGTAPWPTLQHDIGRTGWFEYPGPVTGISTQPPLTPLRTGPLTAAPNPFYSRVRLNAPPEIRELEIYDITGRTVTQLNLNNGTAVWYAPGIAPGVYFCRTGKLTLRLVKAGF